MSTNDPSNSAPLSATSSSPTRAPDEAIPATIDENDRELTAADFPLNAQAAAKAAAEAAALSMPWYTRLGWKSYLLVFVVPGLVSAWAMVKQYAHPETIIPTFYLSAGLFFALLFAMIGTFVWWLHRKPAGGN